MTAAVALDARVTAYRASCEAASAHGDETAQRRTRLDRERKALGAAQADLAEARIESRLDGRPAKGLARAEAAVAELAQTVAALEADAASDAVVSGRLAEREAAALVGFRQAEGERLTREAAPLIARAITAGRELRDTLLALDAIGGAASNVGVDVGLGALAWRAKVALVVRQWLEACER